MDLAGVCYAGPSRHSERYVIPTADKLKFEITMDQFASHEAAEKVHDTESFLIFLEVLMDDWEASSAAERASPSSP